MHNTKKIEGKTKSWGPKNGNIRLNAVYLLINQILWNKVFYIQCNTSTWSLAIQYCWLYSQIFVMSKNFEGENSNNTAWTLFSRTCSRANSSKSFHRKKLIFKYNKFQIDAILNFKYRIDQLTSFWTIEVLRKAMRIPRISMII